MSADPRLIIEINQVSKIYQVRKQKGLKALFRPTYHKKVGVQDISFTIEEGNLYGLIGENGAGKSTTIKLIIGILFPDSGHVRLFHSNPFVERKALMNQVGVVFGQKSILRSTIPVKYSYNWLRGIYGISKSDYERQFTFLNSIFGVKEFLDDPPRKLSLGQRRKCDIVAALLHNPKLILLDEPTIGLDFKAKSEFNMLLNQYRKEQNVTVVISSHDLGTLEELCTNFIILHRGKLLFSGDKHQLKEKFKPKNQIRLKIDKVKDQEKLQTLSQRADLSFQSKSDEVTIYAEQETKMDELIAQCYNSYHILDIKIQSNSLEQILVGSD